MRREPVAHDGDELGVDLVLVLLVVPLELVELDEHHRLLRAQVPPERLADVRDERDHDRERLRRKGCHRMVWLCQTSVILGKTETIGMEAENINIPRCLAVMFLRPAERMAPAPRTTWHVRELNDLRSSMTRLIVSIVSSGRFTITFR